MKEENVFDKNALEYDAWFERHAAEFQQELKAIRMLLPNNALALEIGAGTGRFSLALNIDLGIEPSAAMRQIAENRGAHIVAGVAESLPVDNGQYDFALMVTVDCFVDDLELAFKEVHRVIKDNGFIVIGLIDKNSKTGIRLENKKNSSKFYKNAKFHSLEEIQCLLESVGFRSFEYVQAMLPADVDEEKALDVLSGTGLGSFVVIKAKKTSNFL